MSTRDGSPFIYLANADGTAATRLTSGDKPAWSRDGRRLAFQRDGGIYVIDADGSGERWLGSGWGPAWSPDGMSLVFSDAVGGNAHGGIFVMNAGGSGRTMLLSSDFVQPGDGVITPAWSPDGRTIAFVRANWDEPWQLYVMNADGSGPRSLFGNVFSQAEPSWSPDGSSIAFETYDGIASVNVNTARGTLGASGFDPDWLPDGRGFVFNQFTGPPVGESVLGSRMRVFIGSGRSIRQLVPDAVDPTVPDYSDSQVAYARAAR